MAYNHVNIDGKILKEKILKNDSYRNEVLDRLNYAKIIIQETNKKLVHTNFKSLLKIIIRSCEQLLHWIDEWEKQEKVNDYSNEIL